MSRNVNRVASRTRRKSRTSLYISLAAIAVIIVLLWLEQVALLYVLATLSVAGVLAVVALADLRGERRSADTPPPFDDSAAIGDRTAAAASPATAFGPGGRPQTPARRPRKR